MQHHRVAARTRLAVGIAVVLFLAALLVSLVRLEAQREADSRVDRLGIWSTAQAQAQLARFQVAVERYVTGAAEVGPDELIDAFELLWSRIPLLASKNRPGLDATPQGAIAQVIERLDAILAEAEPDVQRLARGGREEVYGRVTRAMQAVERLLADLNQKIHDERLAAELEKQVRVAALYRGLLVSLLALLISGGTLIALLNREMRRAQRLAVAADEAHAAAAAVSRDLQAVIDAVPATITATDRHGRYLFMNRFQAGLLGVAPEEVVGRLPSELGLDPALDAELRAVAESGRAMPFVEQVEQDGSGRHRTLLASKVPVRDASGAVVRVVHVALDITERKLAEEQARHLAYHDTLTGLPNRAFLTEALHRALARAQRSGQRIALHLIDLDRFKEINDTLGHSEGDAMLVEVAARMACCIREGDTLARMGGDEFAILQEGLLDAGEAASMTQRLLAALAAPIRLAGQEITSSASIGVALGPDDSSEVAELIRHAELALYRAKDDGRNLARFYEPAMNFQLRDRLELEQALRAALAAEAFELHYQPKYRLADDRLVGVEALIRWRHPERGLVPPDRFIALAEDTGLIVPLGNWVLREACRQARRLQDLGLQAGRIAVNLSAEQLRRQDVVAAVADALAAAGADAGLLELELTESLLVHDAEHALRVMRDLKALGVSLALDDFGTGYSALAYLQRFPFDTLKIDRGFIGALDEPGGSAVRIVEAVVRLAHGLGLAVVAEGVETAQQRDTLQAIGCDLVQGYLYSRPVEAAKLVELLRGPPTPPRAPARRSAALAEAVA
jgi:diguanylate cyclase (GGDEF)-like protein/PAS domain S-box-containing protein